MAIRSITEINARIQRLKDRLDALRADFQAQRDRIQARIDQLQAVKAQITPEIEAVIIALDTLINAGDD